jgi:hypothetical protein
MLDYSDRSKDVTLTANWKLYKVQFEFGILQKKLVPIAGATNTYELSYEYKIFPLTSIGLNESYDFQIRVPFDGLGIVQSGRVEVTVVLPRFA